MVVFGSFIFFVGKIKKTRNMVVSTIILWSQLSLFDFLNAENKKGFGGSFFAPKRSKKEQ